MVAAALKMPKWLAVVVVDQGLLHHPLQPHQAAVKHALKMVVEKAAFPAVKVAAVLALPALNMGVERVVLSDVVTTSRHQNSWLHGISGQNSLTLYWVKLATQSTRTISVVSAQMVVMDPEPVLRNPNVTKKEETIAARARGPGAVNG